MDTASYWVPLFRAFVFRKRLYYGTKRKAIRNKIIKDNSQGTHVIGCPKGIPKIVWLYWAQGEENAPEIIKYCIQSWREANAGWDIRVLDDKNAQDYSGKLNIPDNITIQAYSDILRVNLLAKHGGVWADATCYCAKPLDEWLLPLTQSGFFAFANPHPDRVLSSWLLASEQDGLIVRKWKAAIDTYWQNVNKADHYVWLHYLFEYLTKRDREFSNLWNMTPLISAHGPHIFKRILTNVISVTQIKPDISLSSIPVFKLTWKDDIAISDLEQLMSRI